MAATLSRVRRAQGRIARTRTWEIVSGNEYAEFVSVMGKTMWGLWALLPWWSLFDSTTSFVWLAERAPIDPDLWWGTVFCGAGVVHGVALYRRWYWWRWVLTITGFGLWLFLCLSVAASNYRSSAMVVYPLFATSSLLAHLLLASRRA
jgi:hypothetical protein